MTQRFPDDEPTRRARPSGRRLPPPRHRYRSPFDETPDPRRAPGGRPRPAPRQQPRERMERFGDSEVERVPPVYYQEGHSGAEGVDGLFADASDHAHEPARRPRRRRPHPSSPPPRRRPRWVGRLAGWVLALALIGAIAAAAWFGARSLFDNGYADYQGAGEGDVVIRVAQGDTTQAIATSLTEADVVASSRAFVEASKGNTGILAIHPGYYQVRTKMSGENAVRLMLDKNSRVGYLEIKSGKQLDDLKNAGGKTVPGIYRLMSQATCAELNGERRCVPVDELRAVAEKSDLTRLGAPEWLADQAAKAPAERRLEGLVMPGLYDLDPRWSATEVLKEVLTVSASRIEAAGLPDAAKRVKLSPYEVVIVASIIEREGVQQDFGKVARVIYNRMAKDMRLEMDSTINYVLERPGIRTSSADRSKPGPYNSYRNKELPPTPISAPSPEALRAAVTPEKGSWLYFVKCEKNGLSCFTDDFEQHQNNVRDSRNRGVW